MPAELSALRQRLWRQYRSLARLVRTMTSQGPLVQGSFYLLKRKCGKASCRCARGQLHTVWVLTRSESGQHKLYTVPPEERARIRKQAAAWRRSQRARARLLEQTAQLIALADQIAEAQRVYWPPSR